MTVGEAVADLTRRFAAAGLATPRLDARVLLGFALEIEPGLLFARTGDIMAEADGRAVDRLAQRRLAREPVSRILGRREFYGLDFAVTPDTLDPRPETETLVSAALARRDGIAAANPRVLDLGTGTGCILLAILSAWPEASGVGIDLSPAAAAVAAANADRLGLSARSRFAVGDWLDGVTERFDLIVSNPPYIATHEIPTLDPEVREFDPALALKGGADGLEAYRRLLPAVSGALSPGGRLFLELGAGQGESVARLVARAGLRVAGEARDLAEILRCLEVAVA